ncbi:hypothetical protein NLU13_1309 [Sarocladium strictum]|uniref:Uncharacterized protein n=1 Tax=Sarocladium strictum TaxID=5046 RepID=A0AA39GQQ4_SARSR|nr:hypothetical protein NLU13_1309 [Sarocladium strictum]
MAAINGLLSLIGGASGLATLFDFMIPDPSAVAERGNCLVTVQVGLDGTGGDDGDLEGAGGHFPLVLLFNNNDDQIGQTADADMFLTQIGSGAFETLEIGTGSGNPSWKLPIPLTNGEPVAIVASVHTDQICISSLTIVWPDQQKRGWIGDNGAACGVAWYPSGIIVDDSNYETACTWINAEAADDGLENLADAFYVDLRAFNGRDPSIPDEANELSDEEFWDQWCDNPETQEFSTPNWGRRATRVAAAPVGKSVKETRLVVSNSDRFSALDVCNDKNSFGPDFVSLKDGMWCDMGTKTTKPLCADHVDEDCFQLDESSGRKHKRSMGSRADYSKVIEQNPKKTVMKY